MIIESLQSLRSLWVGVGSVTVSAVVVACAAAPVLGATAAGLAVQAALIAATVTWARRSAPRAFRAARWWLPLALVLPATAGALAAATGATAAMGMAAIVLTAALVAAGRADGGRRAAVALTATGPLAAAIAAPVPVRGSLLPVIIGQIVTAAIATAVPLLLARLDRPPTTPHRRTGSASPHRRYIAAAATALAVGGGYLLGAALFPAHRGWAPLTAFVVLGAAVTARDTLPAAVRRAVERVGGAVAGALLGSALWLAMPSGGPALAAGTAVGLLVLGSALRGRNYAYWAGAVTGALVMISGDGQVWGYDAVRIAALATGGLLALLALVASQAAACASRGMAQLRP